MKVDTIYEDDDDENEEYENENENEIDYTVFEEYDTETSAIILAELISYIRDNSIPIGEYLIHEDISNLLSRSFD